MYKVSTIAFCNLFPCSEETRRDGIRYLNERVHLKIKKPFLSEPERNVKIAVDRDMFVMQ